jgi:Bacterial low temperature requirement A protein (LtrA)
VVVTVKSAVPINIDFMIHRSGEWMMLMLGESIFSLLIVDVKDKGVDFYLVFYFSLLTVILAQLLHFQSEPHQADLHAARRSKNAGMIWASIQYLYSLSLVTIGASYTFFLLYAKDNHERRRLVLRQLAGASSASDSDLVGAAHLYSGALAVVFLSLTTMNLLHKNTEERKYAAKFTIALRIAIVAVAATISQWTFEPKFITLTGMLCVIADLFSRKIESVYNKQNCSANKVLASHVQEQDESEEASWPNVTHAGVSLENNDMSKQVPVP